MSDAPQGEGWWQASDGKWYAPELYPADWPRPGVTSTAAPVGAPSEAPPTQPPTAATEGWDRPAGPPSEYAPPAGRAAAPSERSPDIVSAIVGVVGVALLATGSFLDWATVTGDNLSGEVNGLTGSNGWGTLGSAAVVLAGVAMLVAGQRDWYVGAAVTVAALVAIGLAGYSIFDIDDLSDDLPGLLVDEGIEPQVAATAALDLATGVWLVSAGAVASLAAGVAGLARRA